MSQQGSLPRHFAPCVYNSQPSSTCPEQEYRREHTKHSDPPLRGLRTKPSPRTSSSRSIRFVHGNKNTAVLLSAPRSGQRDDGASTRTERDPAIATFRQLPRPQRPLSRRGTRDRKRAATTLVPRTGREQPVPKHFRIDAKPTILPSLSHHRPSVYLVLGGLSSLPDSWHVNHTALVHLRHHGRQGQRPCLALLPPPSRPSLPPRPPGCASHATFCKSLGHETPPQRRHRLQRPPTPPPPRTPHPMPTP